MDLSHEADDPEFTLLDESLCLGPDEWTSPVPPALPPPLPVQDLIRGFDEELATISSTQKGTDTTEILQQHSTNAAPSLPPFLPPVYPWRHLPQEIADSIPTFDEVLLTRKSTPKKTVTSTLLDTEPESFKQHSTDHVVPESEGFLRSGGHGVLYKVNFEHLRRQLKLEEIKLDYSRLTQDEELEKSKPHLLRSPQFSSDLRVDKGRKCDELPAPIESSQERTTTYEESLQEMVDHIEKISNERIAARPLDLPNQFIVESEDNKRKPTFNWGRNFGKRQEEFRKQREEFRKLHEEFRKREEEEFRKRDEEFWKWPEEDQNQDMGMWLLERTGVGKSGLKMLEFALEEGEGVLAPLRSSPKTTATSEVLQQQSAGRDLPMILNGREIKNARHDTGAERGNYIDKKLVDSLHLPIRQGQSGCKFFSLGNGKVVRSIGKVKAMCAFAKEAQTKMKCWFYVFEKLAAPLIMGLEFLEKTKTMSRFTHRLENRLPCGKAMPMLNFLGSTQASKRRFVAFIDGQKTYINADSGSELNFMASRYCRDRGYKIDRRRECRKRIELADCTIVETIGQTRATLTLENGSSFTKLFDILPGLTSDVLLGEVTLDEIEAFTVHENSFVEVFTGEQNNQLCTLGYLGNVNEFLARHLRRRKRGRVQQQPSVAKQQDDAMMQTLYAKDLEARRSRLGNHGSAALETPESTQSNEGNAEMQGQDISLTQVPSQRQETMLPTAPQRGAEIDENHP